MEGLRARLSYSTVVRRGLEWVLGSTRHVPQDIDLIGGQTPRH